MYKQIPTQKCFNSRTTKFNFINKNTLITHLCHSGQSNFQRYSWKELLQKNCIYFICHWKRFHYKYQNGYFCTRNKFQIWFCFLALAHSSHFPLLHWQLSLQRDTSKPSERGWHFTSKALGQPWGVPFYIQSYALPFYSTALPWTARGDDSTCCPAGHRPWGDPCTDSVETEPWLCCHFPDRYVLWWKEISVSIFTLILKSLYFISNQFQTCWKQTRWINCLPLFFKAFSLDFLSCLPFLYDFPALALYILD